MLLLGLAFAAGAAAQSAQRDLPKVKLQAGMFLVQAQVASTPVQRNIGLMWRQELANNEGMLFVFEAPAVQCFWMKNTSLPLTAAFIDEDGTVVNLADMQPMTTTEHCSKKPVRFVLEMAQGWFGKHSVGAGYRLQGPVFSKP
ncbi:MAG TPA: DUF192 domain-containing protein [Macromonas sp.]|nr:DUF192 domain-containing protein [Macromonas sp.]